MENPADIIQRNDIITQSSSQKSSSKSIFSQNLKQIPKKKLHPLLLLLNMFWMLFACYGNICYIYSPTTDLALKGKIAGISIGFTILISVPTFCYLVTFKQLIRLTIIFDNIMVVNLAATIAFVNLILLFDETDDWWWTIMEVGFSIQLPFYAVMTRIFLVHVKWTKWQLITFKVSTMLNFLMFLIIGVYFIVTNYSYTMHLLPSFDDKVHDFMLLYIFSLFSYTYQLYSKITDLDYTGDLKYIYKLKNIDTNLTVKTNEIIKKKRQSILSINLLRKSFQENNQNQQYKASRFAEIINLE